jgi:hypothetical protein
LDVWIETWKHHRSNPIAPRPWQPDFPPPAIPDPEGSMSTPAGQPTPARPERRSPHAQPTPLAWKATPQPGRRRSAASRNYELTVRRWLHELASR